MEWRFAAKVVMTVGWDLQLLTKKGTKISLLLHASPSWNSTQGTFHSSGTAVLYCVV
jgi:hypothetical protein